MAETDVVTDKSFQLKVLGGLAIAITILLGGVTFILETSTLRNAALMLLGTFLFIIGYLAIDL